MTRIEKQKAEAAELNELMEHLIHLIKSKDKRYSFEFAVNGNMEVFDKERETGYVIHVEKIKYDEEGNAVNL